MRDNLRVFISSTYSDLKDYRDAVAETLVRFGLASVRLEDFGSSDQPPLDAAIAALEASAAELALHASPSLIRQRFRKLRKRADRLGADSSTDEYHEVRGQVKKLRYALEAVADLYGKPANDMIRALRRWQENLGVQQDAAVATQRLNALAGTKSKDIPAETLFLMGRLAERHLGTAVQGRKRCATGYRKVRQKWKKLRTKFEKSTADAAPILAP